MISNYEKQYIKICENILLNGYYSNNRTGIPTYKLPHQIMQIDLEKEFPILKSKFVAFKTAVKELLWIMSSSNDVRELQEQNCHVWDEWMMEDGTIGKAYGYQIEPTERYFDIVKVKNKYIKKNQDLNNLRIKFFDDIELIYNDERVGEIRVNNKGLEYKIIEYINTEKHKGKMYRIQFLKTGYSIIASYKNINRGTVTDVYNRNKLGIAYRGEMDSINIDKNIEKKLLTIWNDMLCRCYKKDNDNYKYYGGKGVFISNEWLCFSNFVRDVQNIPNWNSKIKYWDDYQLDKDYYNSNCYSKETCVWLHKNDNKTYRKCAGNPFVVEKDNYKELFISINRCANVLGLSQGLITACLQGNRNHTHGYKFKYIEVEDGYSYRYKLPKNQIKELINTLKTNNQSRRMIVDLWNVKDLEDMSLQPCALKTMWDVTDGKLNCMLVQRSGDMPLGVPFNTTQYAVLVHILAEICNLKVGQLTHVINNAHIYENQIEGIKQQIYNYNKLNFYNELSKFTGKEVEEECKDFKDIISSNPKLKLNIEGKDFSEITYKDIELEGYSINEGNMGKIEMPVSV